MTTFVGSASNAGSVDGTGTAARLDHPSGVAVDAQGNVYIADSGNTLVRKATPDGLVTTIAGMKQESGPWRDGKGDQARFQDGPSGMIMDRHRKLIVTDCDGYLVRTVSEDGEVTTVAKEVALARNENSLYGIALDKYGNAYVASIDHNTVKKVTPKGSISVYAGYYMGRDTREGAKDESNPKAGFLAPHGLAMDGSGNLFVADSENRVIKKVSPKLKITTLAGGADPPPPPPPGEDDDVERPDDSPPTYAEARFFRDGTGAAARFASPEGIAVDAKGNLYVTDKLNHTIRKITPSGKVTTLGGKVGASGDSGGIGTEANFSAPLGIAVSPSGEIYVADSANNRIVKGTPVR